MGRSGDVRTNGVQDADLRVRREGVLAGGQLVQHDAQGEEIAGAAGRLGPRLLGGHVADRAHQGARIGDCGGFGLGRSAAGGEVAGQAEIEHLGIAIVPHHDVLGLDVPVHNPGGMGRGQRLGHLADERHQRRQGETLRSERPQRLPLDQLHDEEGLALVLVHVVHGTDVGVVQGGGGTGFALEPLQALRVLGILLGQELEGHAAAEPGVLGLVDDPHAAASQLLQRAVVGDGLADRDRAWDGGSVLMDHAGCTIAVGTQRMDGLGHGAFRAIGRSVWWYSRSGLRRFG